MGTAVLSCIAFIGLSLPSHAAVFVLCVVTLPAGWSIWNNDVNYSSLHCLLRCVISPWALFLLLCLPLSDAFFRLLSKTLSIPSPWLRILLMPPCSFHRKCPCLDLCVCLGVNVYMFVWRNIRQSISLLCTDCQKLWIWEWKGCESEWELMSLYGRALGDTLSAYHFAMSSDVKYGKLSECATVVPTKFLSLFHPNLSEVNRRAIQWN